MKADYVHKDSRTLQEEPQVFTRWIDPTIEELKKENQELKEDISFCLHSIKQEMEMSIDSRTRNEMTSCYEILKRWNK